MGGLHFGSFFPKNHLVTSVVTDTKSKNNLEMENGDNGASAPNVDAIVSVGRLVTRVARFFVVHTKAYRKMYQITTKCTKCPSNIGITWP
jgi:hypothetical protein